jgi:hypothetical protein
MMYTYIFQHTKKAALATFLVLYKCLPPLLSPIPSHLHLATKNFILTNAIITIATPTLLLQAAQHIATIEDFPFQLHALRPIHLHLIVVLLTAMPMITFYLLHRPRTVEPCILLTTLASNL